MVIPALLDIFDIINMYISKVRMQKNLKNSHTTDPLNNGLPSITGLFQIAV